MVIFSNFFMWGQRIICRTGTQDSTFLLSENIGEEYTVIVLKRAPNIYKSKINFGFRILKYFFDFSSKYYKSLIYFFVEIKKLRFHRLSTNLDKNVGQFSINIFGDYIEFCWYPRFSTNLDKNVGKFIKNVRKLYRILLKLNSTISSILDKSGQKYRTFLKNVRGAGCHFSSKKPKKTRLLDFFTPVNLGHRILPSDEVGVIRYIH